MEEKDIILDQISIYKKEVEENIKLFIAKKNMFTDMKIETLMAFQNNLNTLDKLVTTINRLYE